jgi:hypothetical protein
MLETQPAHHDQQGNPKGDQRVGGSSNLNHVFLLANAIGDHAAEGRGHKADHPTGRRHPAELFVGTGNFEDQPAADEHLHVHRREVSAQCGEEPTEVPDAERIEHRVPGLCR